MIGDYVPDAWRPQRLAVSEIVDAMLREGQSGVDSDPLNPWLERGRFLFGVGDTGDGFATQTLKAR
jgi:hypothetical protein